MLLPWRGPGTRPRHMRPGSLRFNPQSRLVYFDQRMADLPPKESLVDYLTSVEGATSRDANAMLAKAGFPYLRIKGPIGDLSHGERARLVFLRMTLAKPNLYLLDEPTNDLDVEARRTLRPRWTAQTSPACSSPTTATSPARPPPASWKSAKAG